jgi:hypothetical protein
MIGPKMYLLFSSFSSRLSRQFNVKAKAKKSHEQQQDTSAASSSKVGAVVNHVHHVHHTSKDMKSKTKTISSLSLPKDKVPEPCRSCGRSDFPERLHTHYIDNNNSSRIPLRTPQVGWANIRHIFNIRIMNIFDLLFEYLML